jgi:hypothetical protein
MNAKTRALKKITLFLCVTVLSAFALGAQEKSSGLTLSLKLNGGIGFLLDGGGDLESFRQQMVAYVQALGTQPHYTSQANWDKEPTFPALDGELVFQFGRSFGIGIGSGWVNVRSRGTLKYGVAVTQPVGPDTLNIEQDSVASYDYKLTAIPIKLSFYGFLPLGRLSLVGRAGIGYYFGRLTNAGSGDYTMTEELLTLTNHDVRGVLTGRDVSSEESKTNAFGFHGGLGLEYRTGVVAFGLECFGRFAQFSGWSGSFNETDQARIRIWKEGIGWLPDQIMDDAHSVSGKLYYSEKFDSLLNGYYARLEILADKPFGVDIRNSREANINLNAIGFVFSVRFVFN